MKRRVNVIGVGMTKFAKPGASEEYHVMASKAGKSALADAGVPYAEIEQAYAGYVYGDSTCGQRAVYEIGLTGIPVFNVNNNCSTGSTALYLARQAIEGGLAECVLALGFEKMEKGALGSKFTDRTNPLEQHVQRDEQGAGLQPGAARGADVRRRRARVPLEVRHQARDLRQGRRRRRASTPSTTRTRSSTSLSASRRSSPPKRCSIRSRATSAARRRAARRRPCSAPTSSPKQARHRQDAVYIAAQAMTTDFPSTFEKSMIKMVGYDMAKACADKVYEQAGLGPDDVDVVELHDCFTANEILTYEALGLCKEGEAEKFIWDGDNTYGGKWVTNPSGGLLSKGHPLGATGLAQCTELVWQLRGQAEKRQVEGAKVALQHNLGLGGACVITIYRND